MAEQFTRNEQVVSSILTISSKNPVQFVSVFFVICKALRGGVFCGILEKKECDPCAAMNLSIYINSWRMSLR